MIDLVFLNRTKSKSYGSAFMENVLSVASLVAGDKKSVYEVGLVLVTPAQIKKLNKEHRGKNKTTDVLSFPLGERYGKGYNRMMAGDIFVCPAYVAICARKEKKTLKARMAWTVIHGFLHLLGHDHEKDEKQASEMFSLEDKILKKL